MSPQRDRRFSVKLIHRAHLGYWFTTPDVDGDGRQRFMNFSNDRGAVNYARSIFPGHRALVYIARVQKFIWAIEYTGTVEDGARLAPTIQPTGLNPEWNEIFLPIRFLATVAFEDAPHRHDINQQTNVNFMPQQRSMMPVPEATYRTVFDAVHWGWRSGGTA